jgi:hypothetical protein
MQLKNNVVYERAMALYEASVGETDNSTCQVAVRRLSADRTWDAKRLRLSRK